MPRRLSLDENLRAKEGGKEASPPFFTLPMVPCASSLVTRVSRSTLCEKKRKTKRMKRRLKLVLICTSLDHLKKCDCSSRGPVHAYPDILKMEIFSPF